MRWGVAVAPSAGEGEEEEEEDILAVVLRVKWWRVVMMMVLSGGGERWMRKAWRRRDVLVPVEVKGRIHVDLWKSVGRERTNEVRTS